MKKLTLLFAIALIASPFIASAAAGDFVPIAPIPGLTEGVDTTSASMTAFLNNIYKFLLGFAAATAVVMIIWGGLEYATTDSIGNKSEGKAKIQQAILGLILVLLPVLVFSIINPKILDLGVNWKVITPPTGIGTINGPAGPGGTTTPLPSAPTTGCTTRNGTHLEVAVCASRAAATSYTCKNGSNPTIPACTTDASTGQCVAGPVTLYCGKVTTVTYYAYTHKPLGSFDPLSFVLFADAYGTVAPNSAQIESAFISACQTDGGKSTSERTYAGIVFEQNYLRNPLSWSNGCQDAGTIAVDPSKAHGAVCYGVDLKCTL